MGVEQGVEAPEEYAAAEEETTEKEYTAPEEAEYTAPDEAETAPEE